MQLPRPRPSRGPIDGRYCRLEPLSLAHAAGLFETCADPGLYPYLFDEPPRDIGEMRAWIERVAKNDDPLFFTVVDKSGGRAVGRQALMRITPEHGVIEIGNVLWGRGAGRTRIATEALFLFAQHSFDTLGYRRFEWKCHHANLPSQAAARRFGFAYEGTFRRHMWTKGANRDTVWFAMIDEDWPRLKAAYERWLDPANFDPDGRQRAPLAARNLEEDAT